MTRTSTYAPLAQLHDVDQQAWRALAAATDLTDPDSTTEGQARAAEALGAPDLASDIRTLGFYPAAAALGFIWPDLSTGAPIRS